MRICAVALALCFPISAQISPTAPASQPAAPPDARLAPAQDLIGKATFLRCLCADDKLSYNAAGQLTAEIKKPVDWTLAAVNIEKVEQKDPAHLELNGTRAALRFNEYTKTFDRRPLKLETVRILVEAGSPAQLRSALGNIFSVGIDYRLQQATTPLWKRYFDSSLPWPDDSLKGKTIMVPNAKDTALQPPKPVKRAEFDLTPEARQNRITGSILFRLTVDTDGTPHRVALLRPLGFGLDEPAAAAISKWRFSPATKDGQPVPAEITVEEKITPAAPKPLM